MNTEGILQKPLIYIKSKTVCNVLKKLCKFSLEPKLF